jgi:hypothetical protein
LPVFVSTENWKGTVMTVDQLYDEAMKELTDSDRLQLGHRLIDSLRPADMADSIGTEHEESPLINEGGVWVVASQAVGDVEGTLERIREDRLRELLADFKS